MKLIMMTLLAILTGSTGAALAQDVKFPSKSVEIIVPSSPGGGVDLLFRLLAEELSKKLSTQVVIVNLSGGSGAIAAEKVAKARKDGHTVLGSLLGQIATMSAANPKGPVNLARDFHPIGVLHGYAAVIILARADSEFITLKDAIAEAKKRPGELLVAVGPTGTSLTLEVELLNRHAKTKITPLPFSGSAQAITNLLGGHVHFAMASDVAALPHIKAGKLRGLAVDVESLVLPDVPTFAKQGLPEVNLLASLSLLAPKGIPDAAAKVWSNALTASLNNPALAGNLKKRGYNVDLRTGAETLDKLIKEEIDKYSRFTPQELGWKTK